MAEDTEAPLNDDEVVAYIQENFPQVSWALEHPDLGPILRKAAEKDWSPARIYGQVIQTDWWREQPNTARVIEELRNNDPATWRDMVRQRAADVAEELRKIGWVATPEQINEFATSALIDGWTEQELRDSVVAGIQIDMDAVRRGEVGGEIAQNVGSLDRAASRYLLRLSDAEKSSWAKNITQGTANLAGFEEYAKGVAMSQFPWAEDAVNKGIDPSTFVKPYQSWVAQTLEMSEDQVDVAGKHRDVIWDLDKGRMRTLPEVETHVKQAFGDQWRTTKTAHQQYASLGETIAKTFGKVR